jgi:hypothetical protein
MFADEGMWLPVLIKNRIIDMKKAGSRLSASDIYDINNASLKDAVVQFGSGCTGELISDQGLLITNHHCGFSQIQSHSSIEHDYLKDGFLAPSIQNELPNKGLTVKFLIRMEDVTGEVLDGYKNSMTEKERSAIIDSNSKRIIKKYTAGTKLNAAVETFYYGNQYFVFIYKIYKDVRLVAAPPSSIGKFGGDTDNWIWPRHTGDFSIFRIYAGKDNEPAEYSADNVPYKPGKYLKISTKGINEGDFTMVYGYPGRTQEYLHSAAVKYITGKSNPNKIKLRTLRLDVQNRAMLSDAGIRIKYASKNANVANSWKKWQGELTGLISSGTADKKIRYEKEFNNWASDKPQYRDLMANFESVYSKLEPLAFINDYMIEAINVNELMKFAASIYTAGEKNSGKPVGEIKAQMRELARQFYKDYYLPIDSTTFALLISEYDKNIPENFKPQYFIDQKNKYGGIAGLSKHIFENSVFTDSLKLWTVLDRENYMQTIGADPAYMFYDEFNKDFNIKFKTKLNALNEELGLLYRTYMRAQMEFSNKKIFYPDANSTMRVAYGKIKGYSPKDAVKYRYYSTLEGIIEKDNPQIYDYDIPVKLREVYAAKDYGRWSVNGTVPVCFIATNHTSGGNSGSPVLNADGNLIGINFDRVWEGTMSDIEFNPEICRNIILDIRYVMFVLDKVLGGKRIIDEIELVK